MPAFRARLGLVLALSAATPAMAAQAPRLAENSFAQLAQPLPLPYDETADATAAIRAATARARTHHRLLLIDLGGNWCLDCRLLAGTIALPDLAPFVRAHYEVVTVDVGRYTKNMDLPAAYGAPAPAAAYGARAPPPMYADPYLPDSASPRVANPPSAYAYTYEPQPH